MAQSLGPMTAFTCMLKNTGKFRTKWENAVKKAYAHISCIDDLIKITRTHYRATEISPIIALLADISLITTTRQISRMTFALCILVAFATSNP